VVAEDDPDIAGLLSVFLSGFGYSVSWGKDGQEALALVRKNPPDLMLVDVMMPRLNGFVLVDTVLRELEEKSPKIIFLTSLTDSISVRWMASTGPHAHIAKPFRLEEVKKRVEELLGDFSVH